MNVFKIRKTILFVENNLAFLSHLHHWREDCHEDCDDCEGSDEVGDVVDDDSDHDDAHGDLQSFHHFPPH